MTFDMSRVSRYACRIFFQQAAENKYKREENAAARNALCTVEDLSYGRKINFRLQNFQERDQLEEAREHGRTRSFPEAKDKKNHRVPRCPFERMRPRYQDG